MKRKVKKFGRGGDILTALGAGLAGYGAYKYFTKDDQGKDTSTGLKAGIDAGKKANEEREAAKDEAAKDEAAKKAVRGAAVGRALKQSKGQPEVVPEDLTEQDRNTLYESDKALVRTDDGKAKPVVKKYDKKPPAAKKDDKKPPKLKPGESRVEGEGTLRPYPSVTRNFVPNEERAAIPYPKKQTTEYKKNVIKEVADKNVSAAVPKGIDLKGTNKTVYGTDTTSVFQKRAAEQRADQEAKAKKAAKDKKDAEEFRNRPLQPMKKGGAVKKMASGGMARSSASKRADGCAIRGKTRA